MNLTSEDLHAIKLLLEPLKSEIKEIKTSQSELKEEVREIKVSQEKLRVNQEKLSGEIKELRANQEKLGEEIKEIKASQERIENEVRGIRLTIETEIRPNIKLIAEGHLDLNRKFNNIIKIENHNEMLGIRVNVLESEFEKFQNCFGSIA